MLQDLSRTCKTPCLHSITQCCHLLSSGHIHFLMTTVFTLTVEPHNLCPGKCSLFYFFDMQHLIDLIFCIVYGYKVCFWSKNPYCSIIFFQRNRKGHCSFFFVCCCCCCCCCFCYSIFKPLLIIFVTGAHYVKALWLLKLRIRNKLAGSLIVQRKCLTWIHA